ncbi:LOW QUALITY PROTEIN: hypothetical protein V2J09_010712 [Rumex salicifolius]
MVNQDNQEKPTPVVAKRIIFKFDSNWFPSPLFPPVLRNLLSSMQVLRKPCLRRIITWTLAASDINKELAHLTIPSNEINKRFLKDSKEKLLEERDGTTQDARGFGCGPMLAVRTPNLVRWNYKKPENPNALTRRNWSNVLNSGWTDVVDNNRLFAGNTIQFWSFRNSGGSLAFMIIKI